MDLPDDVRAEAQESYKAFLDAGFSPDDAREALEASLNGREWTPKGGISVTGDEPEEETTDAGTDTEEAVEEKSPETVDKKEINKRVRELYAQELRRLAELNNVDLGIPDDVIPSHVQLADMEKALLRDVADINSGDRFRKLQRQFRRQAKKELGIE